MINYSKTRESVEKNSSKKSLSKAPSINKSHTSSIKLSQDIEQIKIPLKAIFKDKTDCKPTQPQCLPQQKKYSVKLQSNEKENQGRRPDVTVFRPFQETNRYLETERFLKDFKNSNERTAGKQPLRLRTDYEQKQLRTEYTETTPEKLRKETSKHGIGENQCKVMKVSTQNLTGLMSELMREQKEVAQMRRELEFYRMHARQGLNPVLRALRL